jgi:hypothetical protein
VVRLYSIVLGFILFARATSALAHGAVVAFEKPNGTADIVYSSNDPTEQEADTEAQILCISRNGSGSGKCLIIYRFHSSCLGVARGGPRNYFTYVAQTKELAKAEALRKCLATGGSPQRCNEAGTNFAVCDTMLGNVTLANNQTFSSSPNFPATMVLIAALLLISSYWPAVKMNGRSKPIAATNGPNVSSLAYSQVRSSRPPPQVTVAQANTAARSTLSNGPSASTSPLSEPRSQPDPRIQLEKILIPPKEPPAVSDVPAPNRPNRPPAPETTSLAAEPPPRVRDEKVLLPATIPQPPAVSEPPASSKLGPRPPPQTTALSAEPQSALQKEKTPPPEEIPTPPADPLQTVDPLEGMVLKIKRSTKDGVLGRVIYIIDARMDASAAIRSTIAKHRLGSRVIYESDARQEHRAAAQRHIDESSSDNSLFAPPSEHLKGVGKTLWKLSRAAVSATRAALSLRITVNSLLSGVHIECKDLDELGEAEDALVAAKSNLEGYIARLGSFDGREEIH